MENNNCNRHIYLYAKHWYKQSDIVEDLKLICAERSGGYNMEYNDPNDPKEMEKCRNYESSSDVISVITSIVWKYIKNIDNDHLFLDFVDGIAPWNTWKVGYENKQCYVWFRDKREKENAPEYDYIRAVLHKYCSMLSMLKLSTIKEVDNCELGEPDYELFPMFKKDDVIQKEVIKEE